MSKQKYEYELDSYGGVNNVKRIEKEKIWLDYICMKNIIKNKKIYHSLGKASSVQ